MPKFTEIKQPMLAIMPNGDREAAFIAGRAEPYEARLTMKPHHVTEVGKSHHDLIIRSSAQAMHLARTLETLAQWMRQFEPTGGKVEPEAAPDMFTRH